jgi:hypothetical protein
MITLQQIDHDMQDRFIMNKTKITLEQINKDLYIELASYITITDNKKLIMFVHPVEKIIQFTVVRRHNIELATNNIKDAIETYNNITIVDDILLIDYTDNYICGDPSQII